ncbi:MAG: hypothetical protein AB8B69_27525, partial [Chitinophagales bacterium]
MKKHYLIFAMLFSCYSVFGQVQIALVNDDAKGEIVESSIEIELVSLKVIGTDDCDYDMQFKGTAQIDLGEENGSLTYRFDAIPANDLRFGEDSYLTTMGYEYGKQVDVWFKVLDKDKPACGSLQDIVDVNSQKTENALKIRIEGNDVWLLNSQNLTMKVLGSVGEVIRIQGNRYVNNNANNRTRGMAADNRTMTNQDRGGK